MLIFNSPSESFSRGVFFATFLGIFVPQELQKLLFGDKTAFVVTGESHLKVSSDD